MHGESALLETGTMSLHKTFSIIRIEDTRRQKSGSSSDSTIPYELLLQDDIYPTNIKEHTPGSSQNRNRTFRDHAYYEDIRMKPAKPL